MVRLSRRTENWFDTVILTVKNRPRNLLLSTRKRQINAVRSDIMCPKCGSTKMDIYIVDDSNPKQPIVHCCCELCGTEWVE